MDVTVGRRRSETGLTIRRERRSVVVWVCSCERCGHRWEAIQPEPPKTCARCKARGFDKPARPYQKRSARAKP